MKRAFVHMLPLAFALALASAAATQSYAQSPEGAGKAKAKSQTARGAADSDPNIKVKAGSQKTERPAPPQKGGQKTRGAGCFVTFDNWTPWYVDVYVDGEGVGTVGPWGDGGIFTDDNPVLYARSDSHYWGPYTAKCVNALFTFELDR
jgi:hypothetical protein